MESKQRTIEDVAEHDLRSWLHEAKGQLTVCLPLDEPYWRKRRDALAIELAKREVVRDLAERGMTF